MPNKLHQRARKAWLLSAFSLLLFVVVAITHVLNRGYSAAEDNILELSLAFNALDNGLHTFLTNRKTEGLDDLKRAQARFDELLERIKNNESDSLFKFLPDSVSSFISGSDLSKYDFSAINIAWGSSQERIDFVLEHTPEIKAFQQAISNTQVNNKVMQDHYKELIGFLVDNYFSGNKVAVIQRQPWLADRISLRLLWLQRPLAFSPQSIEVLQSEARIFSQSAIQLLDQQLGQVTRESAELKAIVDQLKASIVDYDGALQTVVSSGQQLIELGMHEKVQTLDTSIVGTGLANIVEQASRGLKRTVFGPLLNNILFVLALILGALGLSKFSAVNSALELALKKKVREDNYTDAVHTLEGMEATTTTSEQEGDETQNRLHKPEIVEELSTTVNDAEKRISNSAGSKNALDGEQEVQQNAHDEEAQAATSALPTESDDEPASEHKSAADTQSSTAESAASNAALRASSALVGERQAGADNAELESVETSAATSEPAQDTSESKASGDKQTAREHSVYLYESDEEGTEDATLIHVPGHGEIEQVPEIEHDQPAFDELVAAVERIRAGDLSVYLDAEHPELGQLSAELNAISGTMQQLVKAIDISADQTALIVEKRELLSAQHYADIESDTVFASAQHMLERLKVLEANMQIRLDSAADDDQLAAELLNNIKELKHSCESLYVDLSALDNTSDEHTQATHEQAKLFNNIQALSHKLKAIAARFEWD